MNKLCVEIKSFSLDHSCSLVAPEPAIKFINLRINKKGEIEVQLNGKGRWIKATYDKQTQTISFTE